MAPRAGAGDALPAWFIYATSRLIAWTVWAHVLEDFEWDLRWGGPYWIPQAVLSHPEPLAAAVAVLCGGAVVFVVVDGLVRTPARAWRADPATSS